MMISVKPCVKYRASEVSDFNDMQAIRDYHGFRQHKENGKLVFHVCGFDYLGNENICTVLKTEGGKAPVPIDKNSRIYINGGHWNHYIIIELLSNYSPALWAKHTSRPVAVS